MRQKMVAGNWKMHGSRGEIESLLQLLIKNNIASIEMVVFPAFVHLPWVETILAGSHIYWGAQDLYPGDSGAFTGEVSGPMLREYGCRYVLVGHSERRHLFNEGLALVSAKFKAAQEVGLQPVLCLGETRAEREEGKTEAIIQAQLDAVIQAAGIEAFRQAVLAYEPVWAIGTGLTATPEQAQAAHAFIRKQLAQHSIEVAATARILYGGSVKADNASQLFAMPDIDGGLVGGASLVAESFLAIGQAAAETF